MAVKNTLHKIFELGIHNKYFEIKEIGKIGSSCCLKSNILAIDFDETKKKIAKGNDKEPKSCDALKILVGKEQIDFIEMKSILDIKKEAFFNPKIKKTDKTVKKRIKSYKFKEKIFDSLNIMEDIVKCRTMKLTEREQEEYHFILKQPILLTDLDIMNEPIQALSFALYFSANLEDFKLAITDELKKVGTSHNLKTAKLLSCKDLETYYDY